MIEWGSMALGGSLLVSVLLLRRMPLMGLAVLLGGSAAFIALAPNQLSVVAIVLIGAVSIEVCYTAATRPRRISAAGPVMAGATLLTPAPGLDGNHLAPFRVGVAFVTIIAWLIGHSIRQAERLRAQGAAQAELAERLRIARELHDVVAHSIGIIAIQAGAASRVFDASPADARNALTAIEATSRETLAGLRRMVTGLRRAEPKSMSEQARAEPARAAQGRSGPSGPEQAPLGPAPGLAGIERLAAMTLDAGVKVDVDWRGSREPLPSDIDLSAFRIIQEAVTNVIRHAGTGRCQVLIDRREGQVAIEVTDSGRGGAVAGTGYGITGMRERAALLGGEFSAGPRPGGGFRVAARLPVPAARPAR